MAGDADRAARRFDRAASRGLGSLKHRELSSKELRELDYKVASPKPGHPDVERTLEDLIVKSEETRLDDQSGSLLRDILDISPLLQDAAAAIVDDSFLRCFQGASPEPWNWNIYLFPLWTIGFLLRHLIIFPLRFITLIGGFIIFFILFWGVRGIFKNHPRRAEWERKLVQFQCQVFVASWTGVVRYWLHYNFALKVCNHTSMIDYIVLTAYSPFACIMQLHPGWVGFLQTQVLNCLGCLMFNRTEARPWWR